jgi:hypothetical protein
VKKADAAFSKYIRLRDSDENGYAACCTCGKVLPWKEMQCGHWIKRGHQSVRFDERNAAAQDAGCNLYRSGAMDEFAGYILDRWGPEAITDLLLLKGQVKRWSMAELRDLITSLEAKTRVLNG